MNIDFFDVYNYIVEKALEVGIGDIGYCSLSEISHLLPSRKAKDLPQNGSIIAMLVPFYIGEHSERNVAYYAMADDYHILIGDILKRITENLSQKYTDNVFMWFVDASPIPEVELACKCGLGVLGKNTQLLTEKYGSYCFICEVVTDIECDIKNMPINLCISCNKCIKSCPTNALTGTELITDKCRSHITQKKSELTDWETEEIKDGGFVWGCDICTSVCPYNKAPLQTKLNIFKNNITSIVTEENYERILPSKSYGWRGKKVILRNLEILNNND